MIITLLVCAGALLIAVIGSAVIAPKEERLRGKDNSRFYP